MEHVANLSSIEPFDRLPAHDLERLCAEVTQKKFPPHIHIFTQKDSPTGFLYLIAEGEVEIVTLTPDGTEMVVDHRGPGATFGASPIFAGTTYTAGCKTTIETRCYLLPAQRLVELAEQNPDFCSFFNQAVYSRVRRLYQEMLSDHQQQFSGKVEAYPFQKRLHEVMSSPLICCHENDNVQQVAHQMTSRNLGALVVENQQGERIGILSRRDLVTRVIARPNLDPQTTRAGMVMTRNILSLPCETYMYEATSFMVNHQIRHLPLSKNGQLVGMVSLTDLSRFRSQKSMLLLDQIKRADSLDELARLHDKIVDVARGLLNDFRPPAEIQELLSYIHCSLQQRGYQLVLAKLKDEGVEIPDLRFCFIIMGSGGRREMLLGPDQDNGFIYEDVSDQRMQEVDAFFAFFAQRLVDAFATIGYPRCNGGVMASNPFWRGRLKDWDQRIQDWVETPIPKKVMYSTIFFDFMPLAGDAELCQSLRDIVYSKIRAYPLFLFHMMQQDFKHKVPLGLLGRFITERSGAHKGMLSLKQAGSVFIIDCVRMYLLENQLDGVTTLERLDRLVEKGVFNTDTAEHVKAALEAFAFLRLKREIELIDAGEAPSHYLIPQQLSSNEQDLLRESFRAASKLQDSARHHFNVG